MKKSRFHQLKASYLKVSAFRPTELLQVEVEHGADTDGHLGSQEGLLNLPCQVVECGNRFVGKGEVGPALPLIF